MFDSDECFHLFIKMINLLYPEGDIKSEKHQSTKEKEKVNKRSELRNQGVLC